MRYWRTRVASVVVPMVLGFPYRDMWGFLLKWWNMEYVTLNTEIHENNLWRCIDEKRRVRRSICDLGLKSFVSSTSRKLKHCLLQYPYLGREWIPWCLPWIVGVWRGVDFLYAKNSRLSSRKKNICEGSSFVALN